MATRTVLEIDGNWSCNSSVNFSSASLVSSGAGTERHKRTCNTDNNCVRLTRQLGFWPMQTPAYASTCCFRVAFRLKEGRAHPLPSIATTDLQAYCLVSLTRFAPRSRAAYFSYLAERRQALTIAVIMEIIRELAAVYRRAYSSDVSYNVPPNRAHCSGEVVKTEPLSQKPKRLN